ncbi:MAG: metallophosphoesterase [Chloroflexota bacterium]|nr:metallophosphoesterase [Chloroflexota bacterium]
MTPFRPTPLRLLLLAVAIPLAVVAVLALRRPTLAPELRSSSPSQAGASESTAAATPTAGASQVTATLLAVGDIAFCGSSAAEAVAKVASRLPGTIALLGDNAYPNGSATDYAHCFDPPWHGLRGRLRPVPGNHDYQTVHAEGYFSYFGATAGTRGQGWYSYDLGGWHLVALNSDCDAVGGCGPGSPQLAWLVADLAAHPVACTLAYWHHPRFSSGLHGDEIQTDPLWRALAAAGVDIVLTGHDHDYERFAPINGIRSFVVGTGGRSLYAWPGAPIANSEVRANDTYGLLELQLGTGTYTWRFVRAAGGSLTDSGNGTCH